MASSPVPFAAAAFAALRSSRPAAFALVNCSTRQTAKRIDLVTIKQNSCGLGSKPVQGHLRYSAQRGKQEARRASFGRKYPADAGSATFGARSIFRSRSGGLI